MRIFCTDKLIMGYGEDMYNVDVYTISMKKLKKDVLYAYEGYVYKYMGNIEKYTEELNLTPGVYKSGNKFEFIKPVTDKDKEEMSEDNIIELDPKSILDDIKRNKEAFINTKDLEIISNNAEIFIPIINAEDDFLKKLVKKAIIAKKINLSNYKEKSADKWTLTNLKAGLSKSSPVTMKAFKVWCEILGLDFDIKIEDNGCDPHAPLPEPIIMNKDEM